MRLYCLKNQVLDIPEGVIFYPAPNGKGGHYYKTDYPSTFVLSWWIEPAQIATDPNFEPLGEPDEYREVRVRNNRLKGLL